MTVNLDVTKLRKMLKEAGIKFFPAYLWLVTKNLSKQMEFKVAKKEDVLGYYDTLTPLYASFHEDDHTISLLLKQESFLKKIVTYSCHFPLPVIMQLQMDIM